MIKSYKVIDCICRDEFDFEAVARVLDEETGYERERILQKSYVYR